MILRNTCLYLSASLSLGLAVSWTAQASELLQTEILWRYTAQTGGSEIACYDRASGRLFVTVRDGVDVVDLHTGKGLERLDLPEGYYATSVACSQGRLAIALAAKDIRQPGRLDLHRAQTLQHLKTYPTGHHPDMTVFSPDGRWLLSANEGEPSDDYRFDPEGSVTVIDLGQGGDRSKVRTAHFQRFNSDRDALRDRGVRIVGPSKTHSDGQATVAEDLEPEYLAVSSDSRQAWVTLQENNAIAQIDLVSAQVTAIHPLGVRSFQGGDPNNRSYDAGVDPTVGIDSSDSDEGVQIRNWPIAGMFQPDSVAVLQADGTEYLLTANEGDARTYSGYHDWCEASQLEAEGISVDPNAPVQNLLKSNQLGRLHVSTASGDMDDDGDLDELHCFGTRSFAIWRVSDHRPLQRVFDSGSDFERLTAQLAPERYNADSTARSKPDARSNIRGPEPEGIVLGQVGSRMLAFIGLERPGGVMVYDLSRSGEARFSGYLAPAGVGDDLDRAPEGLLFIPANQNPLGQPLLVVCNEVSGTVTVYRFA